MTFSLRDGCVSLSALLWCTWCACVCVCVWGPSHAVLLSLQPMTQQKCVTHHLQISQTLQSLEEGLRGNTPEKGKVEHREIFVLQLSLILCQVFFLHDSLSILFFFLLPSFLSPSILWTSCFLASCWRGENQHDAGPSFHCSHAGSHAMCV